LFIEEQNNS